MRFGPKALASVAECVGRTPLLKLSKLAKDLNGIEIYAKLEFLNPGGSVKDRAGLKMVQQGLANGEFKPGQVLIDATSGNTGIAFAWLGASIGFEVELVMPRNVSVARKRITRAFGATLTFSDPLEGTDGAIVQARKLVHENPGRYFYPDQYSNAANPLAHYTTTAPEILEQTQGRITHFVAGLGTTGTVMGCSRRFKEHDPKIQVIAVEPAEALHGLEGLKHMPSSLIPAIYEPARHDDKVLVATDEGWDMTDALLEQEGLAVGHSSGAAMVGAMKVARALHAAGKGGVIVTVFCDRADRYFEAGR
jgi:cysteine synthase B